MSLGFLNMKRTHLNIPIDWYSKVWITKIWNTRREEFQIYERLQTQFFKHKKSIPFSQLRDIKKESKLIERKMGDACQNTVRGLGEKTLIGYALFKSWPEIPYQECMRKKSKEKIIHSRKLITINYLRRKLSCSQGGNLEL